MKPLLIAIALPFFSLFGFSRVDKAEVLVERPIVIKAVGDVMVGRSVNKKLVNSDKGIVASKIKNVLGEGDIIIGNLESPLIENCPPTDSGMIFCGEKSHALLLKEAGFTHLSLANNHTNNYGKDGFESTVKALQEVGIVPILPYTPTYSEVNGKKFKFMGANFLDKRREFDLSGNEFIVLLLHWGGEYQLSPTPDQMELAREFIDNGADLIIGAHPHVIQPHENYKGKVISYSLGNFIFDQMWSEETRQSVVVRYELDAESIRASYTPLYIGLDYLPQTVDAF